MGYSYDMSGVAAKIRGICTNDLVGEFSASELMRNVEKKVPYLDSGLRTSAVASPFRVTYSTPYAHRQWEGKGISNYTTPGTRSHWEEAADKEAIAKAITAYIKERL